MFWKLVFSNIQHRRVRVGLNCTLIAVPLTLALTVIGLNPPARDSLSSPQPATVVSEVMLILSVTVTLLSMCANVLYRKRQIGIMRFLGGSKIFVIVIVSTEAALIALGGAIFAVLFSQTVLHGLNFVTSAAPFSVGWKWPLVTLGILASAAILGSLVGCSLLLRQHVLDMLEDDCR